MTVPEDVFDALISSLDSVDQDASNFLTQSDALLEQTFKNLLKLAGEEADCEEDYEMVIEALEGKMTEALDELVAEGLVEEDEYVDILADSDADDQEDEESLDEDEESLDDEEEEDYFSDKNEPVKKKKLSAKDELKMLMEPVGDDDEEDDEDDEDDDEESLEDFTTKDSRSKVDLFNEDDDDQDEANNVKNFSSFERAQQALREQIASLEDENVDAERPWALRGEITARQRPSDSLLEEVVEFEHTSRPVPQITEERTEAIEDVIKRRIAEAAWDDVERKDGRDLTLLNGMAAPTKGPRQLLEDVATAQPQRSLTQVYEDDLKTKLTGETAVDAETKEKRAELTSLFAKICRHIDGLSGNRFAPKVYAHSEIQIKTLGKK